MCCIVVTRAQISTAVQQNMHTCGRPIEAACALVVIDKGSYMLTDYDQKRLSLHSASSAPTLAGYERCVGYHWSSVECKVTEKFK